MKNEKYFDMEEILPHRPPMVFIDRVEEYDLEKLSLKARFSINENSFLFDRSIDGVPSWAGIEYMAQTTAALSGIFGREKGKDRKTFGFILGTRKFENHICCYKNGSSYFSEVEELFFDAELGSFKCVIKDSGGNLCAEAEISVFTPENPDKFLEQLGEKEK